MVGRNIGISDSKLSTLLFWGLPCEPLHGQIVQLFEITSQIRNLKPNCISDNPNYARSAFAASQPAYLQLSFSHTTSKLYTCAYDVCPTKASDIVFCSRGQAQLYAKRTVHRTGICRPMQAIIDTTVELLHDGESMKIAARWTVVLVVYVAYR